MGGWVAVVVGGINLVLVTVSLVVELWALVSCLRQRADAFGAVGTLSKPVWMLLLAGTFLLTLLFFGRPASLLALIALTAALVYLLDVRPAIREITGGKPF